MTKLRLYSIADADGDEGYVTACDVGCARMACHEEGYTLLGYMDDEESPASCEGCGEEVFETEMTRRVDRKRER